MGTMESTHSPIPRHTVKVAADLVEDAYNATAPERADGIAQAQVALWTAAEMVERTFGTSPGVAGYAIGQALLKRRAQQPWLWTGVEDDLDVILEVVET